MQKCRADQLNSQIFKILQIYKMRRGQLLVVGAFKIVAVWWGHQPRESAVVGVRTDHSHSNVATILNTPLVVGVSFVIIVNTPY